MKMFIVAGLLVLTGCASLSLVVSRYMVELKSQLPQARDLAVRFDGKYVCSFGVSKGGSAGCGPLSILPKIATATWAPRGSSNEQRRSASVRLAGNAPAWFSNGDAVVFTVTANQDLRVTFECHRMSKACAGIAPVAAPVLMQ